MQAIFISYRRDDSEGQAGRLYDDLSRRFGNSFVFMDVAAIEPGLDFRKVIDHNVASCGVLLAVIGPTWLDATDEAGRRRLDNPTDFVRLETASALKRDIPVVPVLVHGAKMPKAEQLPEDLRELAYRNGLELTHTRWDSDVAVLIKALQRHVQEAGAAPRRPSSSPGSGARKGKIGLIAAGAVVAVAGAAFGLYAWMQRFDTSGAAKQHVVTTTTQPPPQQQPSSLVTSQPNQKATSQPPPSQRNPAPRTLVPRSPGPIVQASQKADVSGQEPEPAAPASNIGTRQTQDVNGGSKAVEPSNPVTPVTQSPAPSANSSVVIPPPPAPINAPAINPNEQRFAVVQYAGATPQHLCMGQLTIDAAFIRYRAIQGTHGVHSFDFPVGKIKEVKKNGFMYSAFQAFHIRMQDGEVFNFSQVDPGSTQFVNPDNLVNAVHSVAQR
jgi:hypothetical protein